MVYRFAVEHIDYSAYAGGHVLHSAPGFTAFPVRLASEIMQRCLAFLASTDAPRPYTFYDPCGGSGYLATVLGFLYGDWLSEIIASDIDPDAVGLAGRNLALLTFAGLDARVAILASLYAEFGKPSHANALVHAETLRCQLLIFMNLNAVFIRLFRADATDPAEVRAGIGLQAPNLVITDVPYGRQAIWVGGGQEKMPITRLLDALHPMLAIPSIVAVSANRQQQVTHPAFRRVGRLQIGHRHTVFLIPA